MGRERRRTIIAATSLCAVLIGIFYFLVIPSQRELILVAEEDVHFYDGADKSKIIFSLPRGAAATILRCVDTKNYIEPIVKSEDGRQAQWLDGKIAIQVEPTGLLSWPQYLGCGDY